MHPVTDFNNNIFYYSTFISFFFLDISCFLHSPIQNYIYWVITIMDSTDLQRPLIDDDLEERKPLDNSRFHLRLVPLMVLVAFLLPLSLAYSKAMLDAGSVFVWEDVYAKGAVCLLVLGVGMRCCFNVSPFQIEAS